MTILFEDKTLLAAVKPAGVPSQPDPSGDADMLTLLSAQIGSPLYLLHRLDRGVGGVMLFAKTASAAATLSAAFSEHGLDKTYFAVIDAGKLPPDGELCDYLYHDKKKGKAFVTSSLRRGVKEAKLRYETLSEAEGLALLRVRLSTGRFHQIRAQLASRGAPIFGDGKYGSRRKGDVALFSHALTLPAGRRLCAYPDTSVLPWRLFAEDLTEKEI